jgi:hypothetical protein
MAVVNTGIAGNRILNDGESPSAQARFDRDVLAQPGVTHAHAPSLTPLGGRPQPWAPENEAKRLALHEGIRTAKAYDGHRFRCRRARSTEPDQAAGAVRLVAQHSSKPSGLRAMTEAIDLRFVAPVKDR